MYFRKTKHFVLFESDILHILLTDNIINKWNQFQEMKKFQYKLIKLGTWTSQYGNVVNWLLQAGIVNKCMKAVRDFYPVVVYQDVNAFKLYYSDMGIMSARLGRTLRSSNEVIGVVRHKYCETDCFK